MEVGGFLCGAFGVPFCFGVAAGLGSLFGLKGRGIRRLARFCEAAPLCQGLFGLRFSGLIAWVMLPSGAAMEESDGALTDKPHGGPSRGGASLCSQPWLLPPEPFHVSPELLLSVSYGCLHVGLHSPPCAICSWLSYARPSSKPKLCIMAQSSLISFLLCTWLGVWVHILMEGFVIVWSMFTRVSSQSSPIMMDGVESEEGEFNVAGK